MRGRRGGEAWDLSFGCGFLLHLLTAAFGTKRTSQRCLPMSAFGVKQTSKFQGALSAFDRKRTYVLAARLGVQLVVLRANSDRDFEGAFTTMIEQESCGAPGSACSLAARHNIPAAYELREFATAGESFDPRAGTKGPNWDWAWKRAL